MKENLARDYVNSFYEEKETHYLVQCDLCKKDKLTRDINFFDSPDQKVSIAVCRDCFNLTQEEDSKH